MSSKYPRRVRDLPKLELDSEDEFNTPCKSNSEDDMHQQLCEYNKENSELLQTNHGSSNSFNSLRMLYVLFAQFTIDVDWISTNIYLSKISKTTASNCEFISSRSLKPKRRAELPTLESDSEEDEDPINRDNLNCAILNDSFLISPGKSDKEDISSKESSAIKPNFNNTLNDTSLLVNFNNLDLKTSAREKIQNIKQDCTDNISQKNSENFDRNILSSHTKNNITADTQFATPQIRSFSVQRRPRELCSTRSQKTKSAIVNEFRTQKVLFQTPMAISRPPIMQNDSISLSLCDTMNECATPTADKFSHCGNEKEAGDSTTSKKSLEGAFIAASKGLQELTEDKSTVIIINNASYILIKKLGCGGSSSVYLAKKKDNGKECALKVVDLQADPAVVEGYLNETKLLEKLQGNVCVVSLYEYQLLQNESKLFLVMEKGDSDLHKILQSYTTNLPLYVLTNFLYQMLQAVNYIHQNGVIHSDLKPANFLMVNGRLKLIDFGIASNIAIDSTSIIKFSQAGTFNYISPEALTDTSTGSSPMRSNQPKIKISTKSDVWSLGCILYLLLYQKTPFGHIKNIYNKITAICNPTQKIEYGPLPPYYPAMLVHMAKNCLQHNPKQRPSCAELLKYPFNMIIPTQNLSLPSK